MDDPPQSHQQQAIKALSIGNQARLQVPATTLGVLEGRLNAHAPAILLDTPPTGRLVRDQEPRLPVSLVPPCAQMCLQRLLLEDAHASEPLLSARMNHHIAGNPICPATTQPTSAGMSLVHTQQGMPVLSLTQLDQRHTTEPPIGDECAIAPGQMRLQLCEQLAHQCPLPFIPFLVQWHHSPCQRSHAALHQQTHVDDACSIAIRWTVQHQVQPLSLPVWQTLLKKLLPDLAHHDALVRNAAGEPAFTAWHLGLRKPVLCQALSKTL
jgi:hypothetical protein